MEDQKTENGLLYVLGLSIIIAIFVGIAYFYMIIGAGWVAHQLAHLTPSNYPVGLLMCIYYAPVFLLCIKLGALSNEEHADTGKRR